MSSQNLPHDNQTRPVIRQKALAKLRRLREQAGRLRRLQRRLRELLQQGAVVEAGRLNLEVRRVQQRRLTAARLAELIGQGAMEELRSLVAPSEFVHLLVTEAGSTPAVQRGGGVQRPPRAHRPRQGFGGGRPAFEV